MVYIQKLTLFISLMFHVLVPPFKSDLSLVVLELKPSFLVSIFPTKLLWLLEYTLKAQPWYTWSLVINGEENEWTQASLNIYGAGDHGYQERVPAWPLFCNVIETFNIYGSVRTALLTSCLSKCFAPKSRALFLPSPIASIKNIGNRRKQVLQSHF